MKHLAKRQPRILDDAAFTRRTAESTHPPHPDYEIWLNFGAPAHRRADSDFPKIWIRLDPQELEDAIEVLKGAGPICAELLRTLKDARSTFMRQRKKKARAPKEKRRTSK